MGVLQTPALTTWPRRLLDWCRGGDLNPYARRHGPLKTACLPNSTTSAVAPKLRSDSPARLPVLSLIGRSGGTRTPDRRFWRPLLYQLSYTPPRTPEYQIDFPSGKKL